ncbi:MAG: hypothetical protein AABY22_29025 [Nanoarchaeota archaeon]
MENSKSNLEQISDREDINIIYTAFKISCINKHSDVYDTSINGKKVTINEITDLCNALNELGYEIKPKDTDNRIDKLRKVLNSDYKGIIVISGHDEIGKHMSLKNLWDNSLAGSSPAVATNSLSI